MPTYLKPCFKCREQKKLEEFGPDEMSRDKLSIFCNSCAEESKEIVEVEAQKTEPPVLSTKINQIDINTGAIIDTYDSPKLAGKGIGKDPTGIRSCLRGKAKKAHDFKWEYAKIGE